MTRRIVRTALQLASAIAILLVIIFFLDNRYRVLPADLHAWSPAHHHGLLVTDVTITRCRTISLLGGCELGEGWEKIEKDLYLNRGWLSHAYVQVQRKKEEELKEGDGVVLDVKVGRLDPNTIETDRDASNSKWESRAGGIWLLRSQKRSASDSGKAITAVDVLFGSDAVDPRPGWEIKDQALNLDVAAKQAEPRISIRRGEPKSPETVTPRIRKDGKFKIAQLSDVHLSTGIGVCRDEYPATSHCDADPRTTSFVAEILDTEKPDLAVLSGDVVNGETSPDSQTALFKVVDLLIERKIPWTIIFGNHDDEGSLSRSALMELATSLPYCLAEAGPQEVDGVGNYVVEVLARGSSSHSAITLYHMDSHAYSPDESRYPGYDWLKPSQLAWFRGEAATRRASDAHKNYAFHHMDLAFIHIPPTEAMDSEAVVQGSGEWREPPTSPKLNSGFKDALVENGIVAVGFGHDHVNDYCAVHAHSDPAALAKASGTAASTGRVWMCYAGGAGYGGYGGHGGFERRVRLWEFDLDEARLETWKRVDGQEGRKAAKVVMDAGNTLV